MKLVNATMEFCNLLAFCRRGNDLNSRTLLSDCLRLYTFGNSICDNESNERRSIVKDEKCNSFCIKSYVKRERQYLVMLNT